MFIKIINLAAAQYEARWQEFDDMTRHEKLHLMACMILAFVFVFGLVAFAAAQ